MLNRSIARVLPNCLIIGVLSAGFITPALAQEDENSAPSSASVSAFDGWTGTVSLGASTSTGSSETNSVNGSLRVGKRSGKWAHWFSLIAFTGDSAVAAPRRGADGEVILGDNGEPVVDIVRSDTSDRLAASYQPRYYFSNKTYGFVVLDWEQDEPAGIDLSTRQLIGIGHRFYQDNTGYFSVEAGVGNKVLEDLNDEEFGGAIAYAAANYLYRVNENVTFNADLIGDFGDDNSTVDASLGIKFKLTRTLAFGITHFVRTNSDIENSANPLSGSRDSVTTLNLVIDI